MMVFNNLYNTTITIVIDGEQYVLEQDPETAVAIADERAIEGNRTSAGKLVTVGTNLQNPYTLDFSLMNIPKSISDLFRKTWEENLKNNSDYRFSVIFSGVTDGNNQGGLTDKQKITFSNCVLRQSPIMTELGNQKGTARLLVLAGDMKVE